MGNEASAEGGDGGLPALPAGADPDGDAPARTETEAGREPRAQAGMSRARAEPPGAARDAPAHRGAYVHAEQPPQDPGNPPTTQGTSGISKSRTVDAFGAGPAARQAPPGKSPSSISLLEPRSRLRGRGEPRRSMFSSNFLSGANPLSAVSSAVNKFSLFGDEAAEEEAASSSLSSSEEEEEGAKKQKLPQQRGGKASAPGRAPQQQAGRPSPQQGPPKQGRGSPLQRGPPPQASVKPAPQKQGSPGPQSQSLPKSGGQPPQGPAKGGPQPQGPIKPGPGAQSVRPPAQGPGNAAAPRSQGPQSLCPLCKTTELNTHTKEQPNYSTCTRCKSVVCSLCGFSPPDSTVKEWLCLNCQMQRALGGMDPVGPPMVKPQPQSAKQAPTPGPLQTKQGPGQASAPSSPQTKKAPGHDSVPSSPQTKKAPGQDSVPSSPQAKKAPGQDSAPGSPQTKKAPLVEQTSKPGTDKPTEGRKPSQLTKQESISDAGQSAYPQTVQRGPASPAHGQAKSGEPEVEKAIQGTPTKQPPGQPTTQQAPSGSPKLDPKTGRPLQDLGKPQQMPKGGMGPPPAKSTPAPQVQPPKQESSFFGLSFGGLTEATKPQSTDPQSAAESVTGKLFGFGGFTEPPKPQPAGPQPAAESVTGKLFGFGGLAEVAKPQPSAPQQGAESVTGKLFGFAGLTEAPKPQASAPQPADSVSGKMFGFGSSIFSSASNLITSAVQDENPAQPSPKTPGSPQQGKGAPSQKKKPVSEKPEKPTNEPPKGLETTALSSKVSQSNCPLCKVELNMGSKDPPNYNTCTECKNTVCNLCGFNPMPHLRENEWLCLNCQTQRALAGQLGDMGTDPTPGAPPSKAAGQQPTAQGPKSQNTPARDTTQAAAASVTMETVPTKPEQKMEAGAERAPATTSSKLATPHEAAASTTHSISCPGIAPAAASSEAIPAPLEKGAAPQPAPPSADITVAPEPTASSDVAARRDKTTGPALNSRPTKESDASDIDHTSVPLGISVDSPESEAACLDSTRTSESAFSPSKPTISCEVADVPPQPPSLDQPARFDFVTQSDSDVTPPVDSTDGLKTVIETSEAIPAISASTEVDVVLQEVSGSSEAGTDRVTSHEPTTAFEDTIVSPTKADHVPPESEGSPPQVIIPSPQVATVSKDSPPLETTTPMKSDALLSESVVAPDDSIPPSLTHSTEAVSVPLQISPPEFIIPSSQDFTAADSPKPENVVVSPIHAEAEFEQAAPKGDTSFGPTPFFEASTAPTKSAAVLLEPVATPVDDFAPPEHTPPAEATSTLAESGAVLKAVAVHQDNVASPEHAPHPEATAAPTESVLHGLMATTEVETINSCGIVSSSEEPEVVPPEPPEPTVVPEGTTALPPTLLTEVIIPHPQPEAVPLETVATTLRSTSSSEAVSALLAPEASPQPASPTEIVAAHSELTLPPEAVVAPVELDAVNLKTTTSPEKPSFTEIMSPNEVVRADEIAPPDTATPPLVKARSTIPEHVAGHPQSVIAASPPAMALLRMKTTEETEEEIIQTGVKGELRKCAPLSEVVTAASPQSEAAPQQLPTRALEKIAETPPEPVTAPSQTDSTTSLPAKGLPRMKTVQALEEELIHEVAKVEEKKSSVELKLLEEKVESDSSGSSQKCLQDITDHSCISGSLSEGPTMKKELLKEQAPNAISTLETCPPPLELAKSESREEMQTSTDICDINNLEKDVHRPKTLPISSESHHKDDKVPGEVPTKKRPPSINFPKIQLYHSEEDGQEKEPSLPLQGKSKVDTDHHHDILHSGDGEEFTHEGVGGCIRQQKPRQDESKAGSTLEQSKWIFKKGAMADEDDLHEHNTMAGIKEEDISGGGNIRDFKIDMESTTTAPYKMLGRTQASTEGELEMESLTNSPEDRSRGEGSSSLHGSSFTPGTSPTSLSSMDEDSDSSPSNKRLGEESKQRKARHRQHGHVLPTIEDSSEEEELREEEELLREQDMQREVDEQHQVKRSSSRKSKMGKEELRAQWRREHPITPPSNLSPIEDASPTEELRQAVEMEELHKSSANSPSVECESGRSETVAEELLVFQKICEPPVSVSFYSPPDEKHPVEMKDMDKKTMDSLQESNKVLVQEPVKRLRTADEAYEDIMKKRTELLKQKEVEQSQLVNETSQQRTVVPAVTETCYVIISSGDTAQLEKGNIIERTIVANEEEIKQERTGPIPGTTQTQATVFLHDSPEVKEIPSGDGIEDKATTVMTVSSKEHEPESIASSGFPLTRAFHSIPDLKITQCSSGEEDGEEELVVTPGIPQTRQTAFKMENVPMASDTPTITPVIGTVEMEPESVICETPQPKTIQTQPSASVLVPVPVSAETEPISVVCEVPQPMIISALPEAQNLHAASAPVVSSAPPSDATQVITASEMEPVSTICVTSGTMTSPAIPACSPTSVLTSAGTEPISVICEVPKPAAHISTPAEASLHPDPAPASILALNEITVVCEIPQAKSTTALASMTESVPAPPAPISESAPVGIQALSPAPVSHPDPVPVPVTLLETVPAPSLTRAFEPVFPVDIAQTQASLICPISQAQSLPVTIKLPLTTQLQSVVVGVQHSVDYSTLSRTSLIENPPVSPHLDNVSTALSPAILSGQEHMLTSEAVSSVGITAPCITAVATSRVSSAVSAAPSSVLSPMPTTVATASPLPAVPQYIQHHSTLPSVTSDTVPMHPPLTPVPVPDPYCTTLLSGSSHEKLGILFTAPAPSIPPTPLPPPTQSQPSVCPKDIAPASTICVTPSLGPVPVSTAVTMAHSTATTTVPSTLGQTCRSQVLPTVSLCYQPEDTVPSLSPKPVVIQPTTGNQNIENGQLTAVAPQSVEAMTLNLITPSECKISATSTKSPLSPRFGSSLHETYVVITLPSEPGSPSESIVTQASTSQSMIGLSKPLDTTAPLAITQYTKSVESQEIWGPHTVVSNTSHVYSSLSTSGQSTAMPNLFTKVLATEVQRTTLSVVCERVLPASAPSTATGTTSIPSETTTKVQLKPKENGKVHYPGDVVDLRTLKLSVAMTEKGMDLSSPDSRRQSFSSDSSGRQTSAVQSSIVNLSSETPASTLSFVTDSITIVTCTATIASNGAGERPLTKGPSISTPLQLTTSKIFEPVAQIIYRPVDSKPINSSSADAPINLSFGAVPSTQAPKSSVSDSPACMTNGTNGFSTRPEARVMGAVDLTTTKPVQMVTSINGSTSQVITSIAEEDGKPVDLTGGRRAVCCDVVYKLPFAGICTAPQPATTLPEDRFGYRDDHYQYGRAGLNGTKVVSGLKPSMSDTNLAEAGLFFYKSRNGYDYHNGATEGAVDLTSGKMSKGEVTFYSTGGAGLFSGMNISVYSKTSPAAEARFGINSILKYSDEAVSSSVAAPVPSTYAITTQPASIFNSGYKDFSGVDSSGMMQSIQTLQNQLHSQPCHFLSMSAAEEDLHMKTGMSKEALSSPFPTVVPTVTAIPGAYIDGSFETIAAPLQALPASVLFAPEGSKDQQYQMERELLELEKVKQLRMAEEIEWERQEIQRFREQEQLIVQQELEKLQTMKQQLLHQQEEERQAHLIMQQETYAQHQLQLEQIHQLQQQLQLHLEEQKMRQIYGYDLSEAVPPLSSSQQISQEQQYLGCDNSQFWPVQDDTAMTSVFTGFDLPQKQSWLPASTQSVTPNTPSVPASELSGKESKGQEYLQLSNQVQSVSGQHDGQKKINSGVQTDGEDIMDRAYAGRRRRSRKSVDSSVQTDDEDQDGWDVPARSRRRSRSSRYVDGEKGKQASKLPSIAIQTVAEISVQTDPSGSLKRPSVRAHVDTKVELSSPEKPHRGSSFSSERKSPQRDKKRPTPLEISYTTHLKADSPSLQTASSPPKSPKVLHSPISPLSPRKALEYVPYEKSIRDSSPQKITAVEPSKAPLKSPRAAKGVQRPTLESKTLSVTGDEQAGSNLPYSDGYLGKSSQSSTPSGTQKKVKRTLPNPPQEEEAAGSQASYSTSSARRRLCRNTTMARVKILQDIDRELDLVERESSKLRQKQAELDEEEKEIDARLRYLEMGINRRRDALLKEREKRERDYLQGVAEERDYMSDSEVNNIREKRGDSHGLERPKTAPQSELNKFIPPQTQPTSPYTQYQYAAPTKAPPQTLYQQSSFYECQQTSPYQSIYSSVPTPSYPQSSHQHSQPRGYQHTSQTQLMHQKPRQAALSDLEPKITTNYEVIRNQAAMIGPSSADTTYGVSHLGGKYNNLNLRMGLDERGSVASSPMSSISADSLYADVDHHTPKNYLLFNDMSEIAKGSTALSSTFSIPDKDIAKADRLLRAAEMRDYLGPLQASLRLHPCMKVQEDAMEEPYELKLLKQQIKQEFRRGADGLDPLAGLHHCYPSDSNYRHFHKAEKYSIGRLTLEKQAAKQLPASVLYQKQAKHRKSLIDPKITKFSPIQESRDLGLDYSSYLTPSTPQVSGFASRARLLQDDITFGLRKSITEQQKYLGSTLASNIAQSLHLGQSLNLNQHLRSSLQDDTTYPSGSRSRPASRPSSVYGLDLSIKRDLSNSSLRLRMESDGTSLLRTKPTNLPISQSRGRIPIVAQNSEEESPLSPVGQPMGMARASAGPLPPISADLRDQFGSSHSLPEVQQHMREESRARAYDRDIAFLMDDMQGVMPDSEAYHLRQEETGWFDKPRETYGAGGLLLDRKQVSHKQMRQHGEIKPSLYPFPHTRVKIQRDPKDRSVSGNGLGLRVLGGKEIPGNTREIGAYVACVVPGGTAEQTGKIVEGMQILEWNGVPLTGKTYEEVQGIVTQPCGEAEICVRLDLNMLSDPDHPQCLELQDQSKPGPAGDRQKSPGVDPNQLATELQKVSQQQAPSAVASGLQEKGLHVHSSATPAASSAVHSPGHPGSPSVNKKRQSSKPGEAAKTKSHPITGDIQLQLNYDRNVGNLIVHVLQARNLAPRDNNGYSDPFVKVYLLPGRSAENKRRSKSSQRSLNPEWNQTVIYKNIHLEQLKKKTLEVTVWDYDRSSSNDFLGEVLIDLSNTAQLDNLPHWFPLKEQSEVLDHGRPRSGQGLPQPPKPSVIKSRSHGVFPDPSKDMQLPTIEKSHSSPGSSKSSSETHLRSHGPSRSQSKGSVTQTHLEDAGVAIAAAEAAVQQQRYQPTRPGHRPTEASVKTVSAVTNLNLEEEGGADAVDSAIFQVPQIGKAIPNGTDKIRGLDPGDNQGKTQVMGEIKIALKKETKTEGEQLIVEILQCRNITYKFKSPDHLPDLYVKLYVVNVATQKKLIKKKTRVCRHDREPSFNETFRFTLNPTGHSLQLFLVSNGGKFVKKTLVGEAYVWLDKVDLRKRTTSWHKLLASSPQSHP